MKQEQRGLSLDRIYLKDLSFESPRPVHPAFRSTAAEISIESQAAIQHQMFVQSVEVSLKLSISGKIGSEHAFYLEVVQAGLFRFFRFLTKNSPTICMSTVLISFSLTHENSSHTS